MKTTEKTVIVEITDNGKIKRHVYPIATDDGELMTHRLRRLLTGKLGHTRGDFYGARHDIHFVGLVWQPPYQLLQEIVQDKIRLQRELAAIDKNEKLAQIPPTPIPDKESSTKITTLLLRELNERAAIKAVLSEAKRNSKPDGPTEGGGWIQP